MRQLSSYTDLPTDAVPMTPRKPSTNAEADRKKALGIAAATLLLGGASWAISQKITERTQKDQHDSASSTLGESVTGFEADTTSVDKTNAVTNDTVRAFPELGSKTTLPHDMDVAGKVTDTMTFGEAFKAAREEVGVGGVFGWHGRWYNTFLKEEWQGLSLKQRHDFTEMVTAEKLPVQLYVASTHHQVDGHGKPTIIEGHFNGHRVMGLDVNQDGVIDTLVMDGVDGYNYKIVDARGDDGLDTIRQFDSLSGELTAEIRLQHSCILSNEQFSQGLEESMSREIVNEILNEDVTMSHTASYVESTTADELDNDDTYHQASSYEADDATYVNNGDVREMDE
ncbi:hypothetical protein IC229_01510 [Spirosoma sp. BT702]|uniref:Uncharacterized protein n=1 Tax=Spirosoma profusum TaxID=2771354 RepID=A0A926XTB4_9BACT|nr:hypothetical protein [Spirosoma profusum]MBD2699294.1 hypothetical protein [Spirosoma profusum]